MTEIEIHGLRFRAALADDPDHGTPWEEGDGWGVITRDPSEDHIGAGWFYHRAESIARAIDDEWGVPEPVRQRLKRTLKRDPTRSEIILEAVRLDRTAAQAYLAREWHYVTVTVTLLNLDGDPTYVSESLSGIESNAPDYIAQVAVELAEQIAARYPVTRKLTRGAVTHRIRATPPPPPPRGKKKPLPPVYHTIRKALLAAGSDTKGAASTAKLYAELDLPEAEALALFAKEHPTAASIQELT